jgi:aryl-alcohol dehydrogenase-like predicted oxidoreductase
MQYSRLGNSGLVVSRLAFGVMTFGQGSGVLASVAKTSQDEANALVQRSLDAGINFFDVADAYANGQSETILGKALGSRRKDVVISTKVGFRSSPALTHAGASHGHILAATEACLHRLGTDYIDLLSIHKPDPFTPLEESARALENLVQRGLVRYVGYSNFSAWQSAKFLGIQKQNDYSPFVAAQMYYSLLGRDLEYEIVPFCRDAGIGIVVWSPLSGGFLTGRYTRENFKSSGGRLSGFDILPYDRDKAYALIEQMSAVAKRYSATVAQIALAWLLAKSHVTAILVGASKLPQLDDNLGAVDVKLSSEDVAALDAATAPQPIYPNWFQEGTVDPAVSAALKDGLAASPNPAKS